MKRYKTFDFPVVGAFMVFVADTQEDAFMHACSVLGYEEDYDPYEMACTIRYYDYVAMVFPIGVEDKVIVHECLHCAWRMLNRQGVTFGDEDHEILALTQDAVYETTKNFIIKCRR